MYSSKPGGGNLPTPRLPSTVRQANKATTTELDHRPFGKTFRPHSRRSVLVSEVFQPCSVWPALPESTQHHSGVQCTGRLPGKWDVSCTWLCSTHIHTHILQARSHSRNCSCGRNSQDTRRLGNNLRQVPPPTMTCKTSSPLTPNAMIPNASS